MTKPPTACPSCRAPVSPQAYDCPKCGHPLRKPRRGPIGWLLKWLFIAFNVAMIAWIVAYSNEAAPLLETGSEAQRTGAAVGTGLGITMIMVFWAIGDVILGLLVLFTRPRK